MPRSAVYAFVAFLGALLLALVFTLGYVLNDGDGNTTTVDVDQDLGIVIRDGDVDFDTLEEIIDILASEYVGHGCSGHDVTEVGQSACDSQVSPRRVGSC